MNSRAPANIRFHRPTYSQLDPPFSSFQSGSIERSIEFSQRDISSWKMQKNNSETEVLQEQYQILMLRVEETLKCCVYFSKQERIRLKQWISKLSWKQSNPVWKKNINFYLKVLLQMIKEGQLAAPFNMLPTEGPLKKLTIYDLPFPLRERFTNQRSCSKNHKKNNSTSQLKGKENIVKQISTLKGYDFTEDPRNKRKVDIHRPKQQREINIFTNQSMILSAVMRPVNSGNKIRKQKIQSSKQSSNKTSTTKNVCKIKQIMSKPSNDEDKQNDANRFNVTRQLFKSKQKYPNLSSDNTMQTQYFRSQCVTSREEEFEEQKRVIFPKMFRLLRQNQATLSQKPEYASLLDEIQQIGCKMNLPQFQESNLDDSALSENSKQFLRASQQMRYKFEETDNETIEFMKYLTKLKLKQNSARQ